MLKIYIAIVILAFIVSAYWAGSRIASEKCRGENLIAQSESNNKLQNEIIVKKGKINEKVNNTGADDIRGILRTKYTIRD